MAEHCLCNPTNCSTPGFPVIHYPLEFAQTHVHGSVVPSSRLILCHPFLLLPSIFPSFRVLSNGQLFASGCQSIGASASHISPSNEHSGLISFTIDWFDFLAVQGTLESLLQLSFSALSLLYCPTVILAHATGKTIALTRQTFLEKWCLCFSNTLPQFVIAFLPRSMPLVISCLQSLSAVILRFRKIRHCFHCHSIYLPRSFGTRCHDLSFLKVEFFKQAFSLSSFTFIKRLFSSSLHPNSAFLLETPARAVFSKSQLITWFFQHSPSSKLVPCR